MDDKPSYIGYLFEHARVATQITREWGALVFGALWHEIQGRFGGFWLTAPLFWLSLFWLIDFALGSCKAIRSGTWSARRAAMSGVKLAAESVVLLTAHAMRDSHLLGASIVATLLESVVLLAEFSSVLIHFGQLSGLRKIESIGRAFQRGSDRAADKAISLIDPRLIDSMKEEEKTQNAKHNVAGPG